ncbi:hypothetical protein DL96DRAFT_1591726 [Flagelloscypha sp. PMI_526]|nr:hypothetical protein DL96DRAFT_1591726 [Flagelloscypha sp. PMI_526]
MSYLASSRLSRSKYSVAIAGLGNLGREIAEIYLKEYHSFFQPVYLLTRKSSPDLETLSIEHNARLVEVDLNTCANNADVLKDAVAKLGPVNVVVNTLSSSSGDAKLGLFKLALDVGASVYFPSEFGIDHHLSTFEVENKEWSAKKVHTATVRKLAQDQGSGIRIIELCIGLFIEDSFGPWFGMDIESATFTSLGPPEIHVSYTSKSDVGRALAELSILTLLKPDTVPDRVRITGDSLSMIEVAKLVEKFSNKSMSFKEEDVAKAKVIAQEDYQSGKTLDPAPFIRVVMGEGKLDWRDSNHNHLLNPDGKAFTWRTVEGYLEGVKGEPVW